MRLFYASIFLLATLPVNNVTDCTSSAICKKQGIPKRLSLSERGIFKDSDRLCKQKTHQKIPKIFHQIWFQFGQEYKDVPLNYKEYTDELLKLHPGWEHVLWNERTVENMLAENYPLFLPIWKSYNVIIKKHDSARFFILHKYGGVYVDHDFFPLKNIESALGSCEFVVGNHENRELVVPNNAFMGATPGNVYLQYAHNELAKPRIAEKFVIEATGPMFLRNTLEEFIVNHKPKGFKIYSPKYFYPNHYSEQRLANVTKELLLKKLPFCYLFQLYDASWWEENKGLHSTKLKYDNQEPRTVL